MDGVRIWGQLADQCPGSRQADGDSKRMRGLILAEDSVTPLDSTALAIPSQLLPVYDKPMIYYPLCMHLLSGIKDILIISTPRDIPHFQQLLGNGEKWGVNISCALQPGPEGPAQALLIASEFIGNNNCSLALTDSIFYEHHLAERLQGAAQLKRGARILACQVSDPERYEVVAVDQAGRACGLEHPAKSEFHYAVMGLYYYDNTAVDRVRELIPSAPGELRLTDLNNSYLGDGILNVEVMDRDVMWLDTRTHDSRLDAARLIEMTEKRHEKKIGCPEEICWRMGYIDDEQLAALAHASGNRDYAQYLQRLLDEPGFDAP